MYKSVNVSKKPSVDGAHTPITATSQLILSPKPQSVDAMKQDFALPKLSVVRDPRLPPIQSTVSITAPQRDFQPSQSKLPSRKVDSRAEAKGSEFHSGFPDRFGTTFVEAQRGRTDRKPEHPTIPKVLPVLDSRDFANTDGLLLNRTSNGKILGTAAQRFINQNHVPHLPEEETVGPSNPHQQLNETWTKCWDREANAVYYYNNLTGEATWIQPEETKH